MRITSGRCKGKILKSPEGLSTRPTSDRARQAVFNILFHAPWCGPDGVIDTPAIDLFAGTGALGLEALSRGASDCVFVEDHRTAIATLRANIAACKMQDCATVMAQSALTLSARPSSISARQLLFCDPPYNTPQEPARDLGRHAVEKLIAGNWLATGCVLVMEMAKALPEQAPARCTLIDSRDYGVARVCFLRFDG